MRGGFRRVEGGTRWRGGSAPVARRWMEEEKDEFPIEGEGEGVALLKEW